MSSRVNSHAPDSPIAANLIGSKRPLIIGHRGYCEFAPENTLPSFELALAAGVDLVELDYRQTKDGELVVIHDPFLDRTTAVRKRWRKRRVRVTTRTAAEIQHLDAGIRFGSHFIGAKIPLLREALDTIQRSSITLIERKAGDAASLLSLLYEKHLINKVVVQSFDWEFLRELHHLEPKQILGALGPPTRLPGNRRPLRLHRDFSAKRLRQLQMSGAKIVVWDRKISRRGVLRAHAHGLKVWVYTINDPRLANRLFDRGVDGVITNNPALLWKTVALRPNHPE